MHEHSISFGIRLPLVALLCLLCVPAWAQSGRAPVAVSPGQPFPAGVYDNLNAEAGGPAKIDLAEVLGKKPFVLCYWIATNPRSEELFQQLQALSDELGRERLEVYGVVVPRPNLAADKIRERIKAIGIHLPVISDEGYNIGQQLRVASVPNVSIVDKEGRLRLTNGASLIQVLGYKLDLEKVIRNTAESGQLMTFGMLDRYYAVKELEGESCPSFTAPLLSSSVEKSWQSLHDDGKVNVLIFWSVDCPHCRKFLPDLNEWSKEHPEGVNIVTVASVASDAARAKTREFCRLNEFGFPTLVDRDSRISKLFRVTTTPTIVYIGPGGVIESASVSGHTDFIRTIEEKKRKLLNAG